MSEVFVDITTRFMIINGLLLIVALLMYIAFRVSSKPRRQPN